VIAPEDVHDANAFMIDSLEHFHLHPNCDGERMVLLDDEMNPIFEVSVDSDSTGWQAGKVQFDFLASCCRTSLRWKISVEDDLIIIDSNWDGMQYVMTFGTPRRPTVNWSREGF